MHQHLCIGLFLVLSLFHCIHTQPPPPPPPEPHPAPHPNPEPHPEPHPTPEPQPSTPEPTPEPHPNPEPQPSTPEPTPEPHPNPEPQPSTPEPQPSTPEPQPTTPEPHPNPEPIPESHPNPEPQPVTPEPHPEPQPVTPEPTPEPQPVTPEPTPEPQPVTPEPQPIPSEPQPVPIPQPTIPPVNPQPQPAPPIPILPDFDYENITTVMVPGYSAIAGSAVLLSDNNDTLTFYGGIRQDGTRVIDIIQYSASLKSWSVLPNNFNVSSRHIVAFSQPPPDSNLYPLYILWVSERNSTVYNLSQINPQDKSVKEIISVIIDEENPGLRIAASTAGKVYIFGGKTNNVLVVDTMVTPPTNRTIPFNLTNGPAPRRYAAMVGYGNGFFLHGGELVSNGIASSEVWQFSSDSNQWSLKATSVAGFGHSAVVSILPEANDTIYFTGLPNEFLVAFDITNNRTYYPITGMTVPRARLIPSTTVAGNRLFIFGGVSVTPPFEYYGEGYQLVNEAYCYIQTECDACVSYDGCSWCFNPVQSAKPYSCVAGNGTKAFIAKTCATDSTGSVMKLLEHCPELFPSWAIALIVIGGVVIIGVIVFGIMKLRGTKSGYDPVS